MFTSALSHTGLYFEEIVSSAGVFNGFHKLFTFSEHVSMFKDKPGQFHVRLLTL